MWLFIQLLALIPLAVMFAAMLALPENPNVADAPVWPIVVVLACGLLILAFCAAILVPSVTLQVRRLHDTGFSGWLVLLNLAPPLYRVAGGVGAPAVPSG